MRINIDRLQVGMTLDENIYRGVQLVISHGAIINRRHIEMIQRLDLESVQVLETTINQSPENNDDKYRQSVEKFKAICHTVTLGNLKIYDAVKDCLDPILKQIENNEKMAMQLWQIETADFYTYEHSVKVCMLSILLSKWMEKDQSFIEDIALVGLLHDIGKCNIPNEILNKPDKLTPGEFQVMKTHATLGSVLLNMSKAYSEKILKGVLHHHERFDGKGYPTQLSGINIPEYARIVAVADVFDAMTSNRVYRDRMNPYQVFEIMYEGMGGGLDPDITKLFLNKVKRCYLGMEVILNNGQLGIIENVDTLYPYRPVIKSDEKLVDLTNDGYIEIEYLKIQ
ncbi:MAG: HD-GYP domain-containing protein [Clostridia bacterium]|nr:HD-GYP domain-containing protein [Clostridia bacterium]